MTVETVTSIPLNVTIVLILSWLVIAVDICISSGLCMNGELKSSEGFKRIIIHAEANQHIQCDLNNITFTDGQSSVSFLWTQTSTSHKTDR